MIRDLDTNNFEELKTFCQYGKNFADASGAGEFDDTSLLKSISDILSTKRGKFFVLEIDKQVAGGLGVVAFPCYFNRKNLRVQEIFWWVDPQFRNSRESIKLFYKIEEWAKEIGANQVMVSAMAALETEKLDKFYTKKGFRKMDINYVKDLNNA